MIRQRALAAAGTLVGLALIACTPAVSYASPPAATLSALGLKVGDLPKGYEQTEGKSETIQQVASNNHESVSTLRSHGWVGEYVTQFQNGATASIEVFSSITHFTSPTGTKWDFTNGISQAEKQYRGGKVSSVPGIGETAEALTYRGKQGKTSYSLALLAFTRGSYVGAVGIIQSPGTASMAQLEHYALVVDGRLKHP